MARYILLTSAVDDKEASRMFNEFNCMSDLAQCIIENYEADLNMLKGKKPQEQNEDDELEYNSNDLFEFMDKTFGELVCLAKQEESEDLYIPYTAAWLKQQVYSFLRTQYEFVNSENQPEQLAIESPPEPNENNPKPIEANPEPSGSQPKPNKPLIEVNGLYPKPARVSTDQDEVVDMESEGEIELIY